MNSSRSSIATISLTLSLFLFLNAMAFGADAPVYKDGDWWVFRIKSPTFDGDYKITFSGEKFECDDPALLDAGNLPTIYQYGSEKKFFDFPLVVGKKWTFRHGQRNPTTRQFLWRDNQVEVIGPASPVITTAAGSFPSIEIRKKEIAGRQETNIVYFYSSQTKSVIKFSGEQESPGGKFQYGSELIKFFVQ